MATAIIYLVNHALERVQEIPIQTTDYDSGVESHMMTCRQAVSEVLKKMYLAKKDAKLKSEFTLNTVASQAQYNLGFDGSLLADTNLRVILSDKTDYWLTYRPESEALEEYIDFNNLDLEAKPAEWWFVTSSTPNAIQLRLNPIPDDIYAIKGFKYVPYSAVTAITITTFTDLGDEVIIAYVAAELAKQLQKDNTQDLISKARITWGDYILEDQKTDQTIIYSYPYQQSNLYD